MDNAVSFIKGSDSLIEGLAIPFGGPLKGGRDIDGERFTPETDLGLDWFPSGRPVIYEHGLDGAMKTHLQGRQTDHEVIAEGVWARAQLDRSAKYHATVKRLINQGALYFSSGTMNHLARGKSGTITQWPWVELSLTTTPANPFAVVHAVKSSDLLDRLAAAEIPVPADLIAVALKALDEQALSDDEDDGSLAGLKFADHADRLLADVEEFRDRAGSIVTLRAKAGRVLSAATRTRLVTHPEALRQVADDLDTLLSEADSEKSGKSIDLAALAIETERQVSRSLGVTI